MKGLLLRNLYSLRIPVLIAAAVVLILSLSGSSSAAFVIPFAAMGIAVLPCPLFAADAQSRFESYRLTLPVKRRTIADAYYLTVLLLTVILLLFSLLMLLRNQMDLKLYYLSNLTAYCLLMPAVFLPLTLRFGRIAGMIAAMIVLVLYMMAFPMMILVAILTMPTEGAVTVSASYSWYELLPGPVVTVLFSVSWLLSRRLIEKREF